MKKTVWIACIVILAVAGVVYWRASQPDAVVETVQPQRRTLRAYVEEQAITALPQDYLIASPIDGRLEPITLREGDPVKEGQVVANLDTADLSDRVSQAKHRIAVLETEIARAKDHRLEHHALVDAEATVKAIDDMVKAAEAKLKATLAIAEFARSEAERIKSLAEGSAASAREVREIETERRRAEAEYQGDVLELAALKTLASVSYIGPQFIRDYIDRKSFELDTLQQQLAEAKTELEIVQRNLDRAVITSPIDGVILERRQTRRQFIPAGTPLLTVGRLEEMEVIAEVLSERATRISPGDPVEVYGEAIPDGPIAGEVLRVYPAGFRKISSLGVEQQRVNVAIQLHRRPERLGTEYRVQVRIYYDQAEDALTVPRTALFRGTNGQWNALVIEEGITRLQEVEVGLMNDERAEVLGGLDAEDVLVAKPARELRPGMEVSVTD